MGIGSKLIHVNVSLIKANYSRLRVKLTTLHSQELLLHGLRGNKWTEINESWMNKDPYLTWEFIKLDMLCLALS